MAFFFPTFKIFDDALKPKCRIIFESHLNFSYRYEVSEAGLVVSNRQISFNINQICPSEQRCAEGFCSDDLCKIPEEEFTTCCFEWTQNYEDPEPGILRGKKVEVSTDGSVKFLDVHPKEQPIDLNWRRLRTMARPIVDEALGRLAMSGLWKTKPIRVSLGSLVIDNKRVRIDENSYFEMDKTDDIQDLERCDKQWKTGHVKRVKSEDYVPSETHENDENNPPVPLNLPDGKATHHVETNGKETKEEEDDTTGTMLCELCLEDPCVWITKKQEMLDYDDSEHDYLPSEDFPPHNVRRKKIYRQMALYINSGPSGKGVRIELPKCVVDGCRECFPSPTFMGFKAHHI
jgi:hypothetical protein